MTKEAYFTDLLGKLNNMNFFDLTARAILQHLISSNECSLPL